MSKNLSNEKHSANKMCRNQQLDGLTDSKGPVFEAQGGSANIYRDIYGVPHIYAEREADGYWGLGYAVAQDRLYSLLITYINLKGELAEHFGPGPIDIEDLVRKAHGKSEADYEPCLTYHTIDDPVQSDIEMRRWRHLEIARENFLSLSPQTQANMTAYVEGIQCYLDDHPEKVPDWAPVLEPAIPLAGSSVINLVGVMPCARFLGPEPPADDSRGSNAFALAPHRTMEGATIFSSDSHAFFDQYGGTFFHAARIKAGELDAWLLDSFGVPMGMFAHTRHYGWGCTEAPRYPDDCISVTTKPDDPTAYEMDNVIKRMRVEPYEIKVQGEASIQSVFEYTEHNGVFCPVVGRNGDTAYAVSWAYMGRAGFAVEQYRMMMGAKSADEMTEALKNRDIYPANHIIGGGDEIRYIRGGRTPIRPDGADGTEVVDGSMSESAWKGIRGYDELLQVINPEEGYLSNSNISPDMMFSEPKLDPKAYPPDYGFKPSFTGNRQKRSIALLEGEKKISFDEALEILADAFAAGYDKWNAAFAELGARYSENDYFKKPSFEAFFKDLTLLDGHFVPESRMALVHHMTRDALGTKQPLAPPDAQVVAIEDAVLSGQPLTSAQQEQLFAAVCKAYDRLQVRSDAETATYGDLYRVGRGGVREPARGVALKFFTGMTSFFPTRFAPDGDGPGQIATAGARHPFIVQFTDPIRSMSAAAHGASDDPDSPHYSDQCALRGAGKLHSNFFSPEELAGVIESMQTFNTDIPLYAPFTAQKA